ncbi:MAG: hypothetical protein MUE53_06960, partial [Chitinophagales bacterium]|nr:hypothetical protein [Chitinophagales bacterium]
SSVKTFSIPKADINLSEGPKDAPTIFKQRVNEASKVQLDPQSKSFDNVVIDFSNHSSQGIIKPQEQTQKIYEEPDWSNNYRNVFR